MTYKNPNTLHLKNQVGFTIVELMISLSILSVLLVAASSLMSNIGALYNKGVNAASLQNTNRTILADISNTLQFSGDTVARGSNGSIASFCIGTARYSYILNKQSGKESPHVLWRDTMSSAKGTCPPLIVTSSGSLSDGLTVLNSGYDMVPVNMRLGTFSVAASGNVYTATVSMAYGDSDLVVGPDANGYFQCKGDTGTQYCAVSHLSTSVVRRVNLQ